MTSQPAPPVEYPAAHFLVLNIAHFFFEDYKLVVVTTDVACILTMFFTPWGPYPEPRTKIVRGEPTTRDPHITCHPWSWIRQEEPAGVTVHSFKIPRDDVVNDIWYYFIGGTYVYSICPNCAYYPVDRDRFNGFYCRDCHNFFALPICFKCPICGSFNWRYGWWRGYYCPNCNHRGNVDDLESVWKSKSQSPFFHQKFWWPPLMEISFYEPWSSLTPGPQLVFYEPWSAYS